MDGEAARKRDPRPRGKQQVTIRWPMEEDWLREAVERAAAADNRTVPDWVRLQLKRLVAPGDRPGG